MLIRDMGIGGAICDPSTVKLFRDVGLDPMNLSYIAAIAPSMNGKIAWRDSQSSWYIFFGYPDMRS